MHTLQTARTRGPFRRTTLIERDSRDLPEVLTDPRALRKAYLAGEVDHFLHDVKLGCRTRHPDYLQLRTDQPLDIALSVYLSARMSRMK